MAENRKTLKAPEPAIARFRALGDAARKSPVERVREITVGGGAVATAVGQRRDPKRPRVPENETPAEIGLHPTGEFEPTIRNAITETLSKFFDVAIKIKAGRIQKAVDEIERRARQDTSTTGPTKRQIEIADQHYGMRKPRSANAPHKIRGTLDVFGSHFTKSERTIFERFVRDAELATAVNLTSKIYEAMPRGGSLGSRSGHITESQRLAYSRFYYVWRRLGPQFQTICGAAVLEIRSESLGRPFSLEEIGAQATSYTDRALCRAAALGFTKATLWRLAELYVEWDGLDETARRVLSEARDEVEASRTERIGRTRGARSDEKPELNEGKAQRSSPVISRS